MEEPSCTSKKVSIGGSLKYEDSYKRGFVLRKLIAVEGQDEVLFFDALLKFLNVAAVEVREVGGKNKFEAKLASFVKLRGFDDIESIAFVCDADNDGAQRAFERLTNIIERVINREESFSGGLVIPSTMSEFSNGDPRIGIYVMPNNLDNGMLENLCLETVESDRSTECVNTFMECALQLDKKPKSEPKARVQTFLAAKEEIVNRLGLGAQKGYWNFDSPVLDELKSFISQI